MDESREGPQTTTSQTIAVGLPGKFASYVEFGRRAHVVQFLVEAALVSGDDRICECAVRTLDKLKEVTIGIAPAQEGDPLLEFIEDRQSALERYLRSEEYVDLLTAFQHPTRPDDRGNDRETLYQDLTSPFARLANELCRRFDVIVDDAGQSAVRLGKLIEAGRFPDRLALDLIVPRPADEIPSDLSWTAHATRQRRAPPFRLELHNFCNGIAADSWLEQVNARCKACCIHLPSDLLASSPQTPGESRRLVRAVAKIVMEKPAIEGLTTRAPTTPSPAGYLGLIVDENRGEVRRVGHNHGQPVSFDRGTAQWHTFMVAFRAGEQGATQDQWRRGYPGEWSARRKVKSTVNAKLSVLNVCLVDGELKLEDISTRPM